MFQTVLKADGWEATGGLLPLRLNTSKPPSGIEPPICPWTPSSIHTNTHTHPTYRHTLITQGILLLWLPCSGSGRPRPAHFLSKATEGFFFIYLCIAGRWGEWLCARGEQRETCCIIQPGAGNFTECKAAALHTPACKSVCLQCF